MRFARLNPDLTFLDIILMEESAYNDLLISNPEEASLLRLLVDDPLPTIDSATQKIVAGEIVVDDTQARQTWLVVDKTAEELEADELEAEQAQIADRLTKLTDAIAEHQAVLDVPYSEPAPAATNGLEITALRDRMRVAERAIRSVERDLIVTMRSAKWILRKLRTGTSA